MQWSVIQVCLYSGEEGETKMKNLLPSILPVLVLISGAVSQPVQNYVAQHPLIALVASTAVAILNHFLPSPVQK